MAKGFRTDNMTVSQILSMDPRAIGKMGERELSRTLRTLSLAANKRVDRLKQYAQKSGTGKWMSKGTGRQIATDALNWVTDDGKRSGRFGVKQVSKYKKESTRLRKMREQMHAIRTFMGMKTSKVAGATEIRKNRETWLFGKTREQAARGLKGGAKSAVFDKYKAMYDQVWEMYHKMGELENFDPHAYSMGSEAILEAIGNAIADDNEEADIINAGIAKMQEIDAQQQEERRSLLGDDFTDFGHI